MPDPPSTNLLSRYVLENPYPLTIFAAVAAFILLIVALREGRKSMLTAAGITALLGAIVWTVGTVVTTPAEHGERVTRTVIETAVSGDVSATLGHFTEDAALAIGSPTAPGLSLNVMRNRLDNLHRRFTIESNRITRLRGYTESETTAVVHASCSTVVSGGYGSTGSQWIFRVEQQPDGTWMVTRLTAISIAGRTPSNQLW